MAEQENLNKGHRQRLKRRYLENGFSGFSDHEVIELILFYAIPYKNTKDIAKRLLSEVGGIKSLLELSAEELMLQCGVSEHVAILLTMNLDLHKRYLSPGTKRVGVDTPGKVWNILHGIFLNERNECFYLLCIDSDKKLIKSILMSRGTKDETAVYIREIISEAIKTNAHSVIIAHNHPNGSNKPSDEDIAVTKNIAKALKIINVKLLDHIIAVGDGFISFKAKKILDFSQL